jgi:hypothetical protein
LRLRHTLALHPKESSATTVLRVDVGFGATAAVPLLVAHHRAPPRPHHHPHLVGLDAPLDTSTDVRAAARLPPLRAILGAQLDIYTGARAAAAPHHLAVRRHRAVQDAQQGISTGVRAAAHLHRAAHQRSLAAQDARLGISMAATVKNHPHPHHRLAVPDAPPDTFMAATVQNHHHHHPADQDARLATFGDAHARQTHPTHADPVAVQDIFMDATAPTVMQHSKSLQSSTKRTMIHGLVV